MAITALREWEIAIRRVPSLLASLGVHNKEWFLGGPWCFILNQYPLQPSKSHINVQVKASSIAHWLKNQAAKHYMTIHPPESSDYLKFLDETGYSVDFILTPDVFFTEEFLRKNTKMYGSVRTFTPAGHLSLLIETAHLLREGVLGSDKTARCLDETEQVLAFAKKLKDIETIVLASRLAKLYKNIIETQRNISHNRTDMVKGKQAHPGRVFGSARIVLSKQDLSSVKKGDILITSMPFPECMLVANKISAIVTDHGGTLCHAAILSREYNLPCVVSTGYATCVFKNGDWLLVDADNGIVKKTDVFDAQGFTAAAP